MKNSTIITKIAGCLLITLFISSTAFTTTAQIKPDVFEYITKSDYVGLQAAILEGADINKPNKSGNTPLMVAAKIGDGQVLRTLLSFKADVNAQNKAGATALMIAAKYDFPYYVTELLKNGADPTIKTHKGYTAATFALGYKRHAVYEQLKEAEIRFLAAN